MIMRILGEGQYEVPEERLDLLNRLDSALQSAAESGDEAAFTTVLESLLEAVRDLGAPLPDETITPSDLVLPAPDSSLRQVRELLTGEGVIPG